jgi:hypothetical protein
MSNRTQIQRLKTLYCVDNVAPFSRDQGNSGGVFALSGAFAGLLIHARFKVASFTSMVETVIAHWESFPRIPPPNGSVLASSHGWASSTRYGTVAYGEIDDLVDGLKRRGKMR